MQLADRIDFMELISVSGANPNGDPAKLGMPRTDSRGFGVISPVCIRRKLRDRLSESFGAGTRQGFYRPGVRKVVRCKGFRAGFRIP